MTGDQRHTISGEKTIFGEFSRVYALLTNTSLFDFFFLVSLAWHLFLLGYQDPTIDGNYELRNVADHRLRTCRRDASR